MGRIIDKACEHCGKYFEVPYKRRNNRKYCSECRYLVCSLKRKDYVISEETKEKIRQTLLGRTGLQHTDEAKKKMSELKLVRDFEAKKRHAKKRVYNLLVRNERRIRKRMVESSRLKQKGE